MRVYYFRDIIVFVHLSGFYFTRVSTQNLILGVPITLAAKIFEKQNTTGTLLLKTIYNELIAYFLYS